MKLTIRPQGHWCNIKGPTRRPARSLSANRSTDTARPMAISELEQQMRIRALRRICDRGPAENQDKLNRDSRWAWLRGTDRHLSVVAANDPAARTSGVTAKAHLGGGLVGGILVGGGADLGHSQRCEQDLAKVSSLRIQPQSC